MLEFSPIQSKRIADASMYISRRRAIVLSHENEMAEIKDALKIAKQELDSAYRSLDELTIDAASGKEPLPNLFEINARSGEPDSDSPQKQHASAAYYRDPDNVIRPKRRVALRDAQNDAALP